MKILFVIILNFLFFSSTTIEKPAEKEGINSCKDSLPNDEIVVQYSENDIKKVTEILKKGKKQAWYKKELGQIVLLVGNELLETEYVGGVLDKNTEEQLTINLSALDCVTFVENCSTLAGLIKRQKTDFDSFTEELRKIRYRNGKIESYASRLHYFSDWLYENEKSKRIEQLSRKIANTPYLVNLFIMSENHDKYPLINNESLLQEIKAKEIEISARTYFYIPENEINKHKNQIPDGAIIAITTDFKGIEIAHTGFAIHQNGELHLLHASSKSKKVEISELSIENMLLANKLQTGIMVSKLLK